MTIRIRNKLNKIIDKLVLLSGLRPDSFPYLTGDGFRKIADHIYDETGLCIATNIKDGQIIFLKSDKIIDWFENIHPEINNKYILISHNSDYNITESDLRFIDERIIRWYAQNVKTTHPKLTPIPIGINNLYLNHTERPALFRKVSSGNPIRKNRIIFAFSINTNPIERQLAHDALMVSPTADKLGWIQDRYTYLKAIMNYKFIAAPDGNGNDDPRRWQAMYIGVVPIVKRTPSMEYFRSLGLPIYIIDDWNELIILSEKDLEKKYNELRSGFDRIELYSNYWINKIKKNDK